MVWVSEAFGTCREVWRQTIMSCSSAVEGPFGSATLAKVWRRSLKPFISALWLAFLLARDHKACVQPHAKIQHCERARTKEGSICLLGQQFVSESCSDVAYTAPAPGALILSWSSKCLLGASFAMTIPFRARLSYRLPKALTSCRIFLLHPVSYTLCTRYGILDSDFRLPNCDGDPSILWLAGSPRDFVKTQASLVGPLFLFSQFPSRSAALNLRVLVKRPCGFRMLH